MNKTEIPEDLCCALCALSFFRRRREKRPRFKKPKRRHNAVQMVSNRKDAVRLARHFIKRAREAGFKGSVLAQIKQAMQ